MIRQNRYYPQTSAADLFLLHAPSVYDFRERDDLLFAYLSLPIKESYFMNNLTLIKHFIIDELMSGNDQIDIGSEESLFSCGVLDSMAFIQMIAFIEVKFGITVEDGEVIPENFETISQILAFVKKKQNDR